MSCKAPVITSNLTSIPEVTGDNAILINPHNINELEKALVTLLNDESLKTSLSEKGYLRSLEFTWAKTAQNTLNVYKNLVTQFLV
jgi:glycosyltransferase involved in cell wall biosynthesis